MKIRVFLSALLGLALGSLLAVLLVFGPISNGGIHAGPWETNVHVGSVDAPATVRAITARRGLLALRRQEATYFSAYTDNDGRRLSEDCDYRVVFSQHPDSKWWSLTLYAEDDFLAVNGLGAHSVSMDDVTGRSYEVLVSSRRQTEVGLASNNAGAFTLMLRLYLPSPELLADPATTALPVIERLSCRDEP